MISGHQLLARQHRLDPDHAAAPGLQLGDRVGHLLPLTGGVGGARAEHQADLGRHLLRRGQQVHHALLAGDPADEQGERPVGVDAEPADDVGVVDRAVGLGVHAVADDVHPRRIEVGVGVEDVGAHPVADGDDRVRGQVRRPLHPRGEPVAAAELVGLPRAAGLERVGRHDVRGAVHERGQQPGGVGVPGVAVHQVGLAECGGDLDVDTDRLQRTVGALQIGRHGVGGGVRSGRAEAVDVDGEPALGGVDRRGRQRPHGGDEVLDVHPRPSVDVRRPLAGHDPDAHAVTLGGGSRT